MQFRELPAGNGLNSTIRRSLRYKTIKTNTMMPSFKLLAACLLFVAVSDAFTAHRQKRQTFGQTPQFDCSRGDGTYPISGSCTQYYQCTNNVAGIMECPSGLVFNSRNGQNGICDWPVNVPSCSSNTNTNLRPEFQGICNNQNMVQQTWPYKVNHPFVCNAFMTCIGQYLSPGCEVCPQETYFNATFQRCVSLGGNVNNPSASCGNRRYEAFNLLQRVQIRDCYIYNGNNPYQPLIDSWQFGNNNNNFNTFPNQPFDG